MPPPKKNSVKANVDQVQEFKEAAREAGADMDKDEFGHVLGGLAKPDEPKKPDQARDDEA